ncbi:hypothetical protein GN244_ATG05160 [Phytophthora infestans]|uniref:RxLR effector PexRD54 WY domain-containing protein n=1 Tax=Phytophthora infestans TaxID=4787 RepID=A0A833WHX5_PHYIN|nr:hypothetical protein GN244_ATG05160 [Phytophthora infestans]
MNKTSLRTFLNCFVLLSILVLLEPVGGGPVSTTVSNRSVLSNETSNGAVNADINRMQTWSAKDDEYDTSEERVDIKVPGAEKLKGIITSGTTKLEKFASRVKNRLAFNNQKGTEDSVANLGVGAAAEAKRIESTSVNSVTNLDSQKATEDGIAKLGVGAMESKRTDTALAQSVTTINNKRPELNEEAFRTALTAQYGDDALTKLLVEAQSPGASQVATMVKAIQFDNWVTQKKTAGDIYNLLKLNVEDADVLVNPLLPTWISFVKTKLKEDPYDFLLLKLAKQYEEDALHKRLMAASTTASTRDIASGLEFAQIKKWLTTGKAEDDVLKISLVPADKELGLLKHPALQTFISYATKHHTLDPYEFLVLKLAKRHGEDELPKMLVKAKSDSDLVSMAVKLESTQFKIWKEKGKTSDDVFKMLRLDIDQSIDTLKSPGLVSWFSYVKKISENPTEVLYRKLEIRFSDAEILKMFFAGKNDGTLKFTLGPMVRLIKGNWLSQKKTAEDVFTDLSLDKDGINFFENPILVTWFTYVKSMHKEEADNVMSSVMTKYYDDETLKKMVTHSSITGNLKATAAQVASALWLRDGMPAHEAFKLLRLSGKGDNALSDPAFGTWVSYFNKLQRKKMNQDEYAIIAELSKHFDNDLDLARALCAVDKKNPDLNTAQTITSLQNLQFKQWIQKKQWNVKELRYADPKYWDVYHSFYTFSYATRGS